MITLADIDGQSLSSVICDFMICKRCGIVDRERSRIIANSPCPACHKSADIARLYFGLNLAVLIDLIQQSYHSATPEGQALGPQSSDVAVVLFFCALREALLNNLLDYLCRTEACDLKKVATRRKLTKRKFSSLAELIGKTWDEAVGEASSREGIGFDSVSKLMIQASSVRNRFLHEASGWGATRQFATECINSTFALLQLFVSLHNTYVQPRLANQRDGKATER
jgi:hypothetical protein